MAASSAPKNTHVPAPTNERTHRKQQQTRRLSVASIAATKALAAADTISGVVVVTQDAAATMPWKARYEQMREANERLNECLSALESTHRKYAACSSIRFRSSCSCISSMRTVVSPRSCRSLRTGAERSSER